MLAVLIDLLHVAVIFVKHTNLSPSDGSFFLQHPLKLAPTLKRNHIILTLLFK